MLKRGETNLKERGRSTDRAEATDIRLVKEGKKTKRRVEQGDQAQTILRTKGALRPS